MPIDLVIEGEAEALAWLSLEITKTLTEADLETVTSQHSDELREPFIIALIVALGGPAMVKGVVKIVDRYFQHLEEMRKQDIALKQSQLDHIQRMSELKFKYLAENDTEIVVSLKEIRLLAIQEQ